MYIYKGRFDFNDKQYTHITFEHSEQMKKGDFVRSENGFMATITDCENNFYSNGKQWRITIKPWRTYQPSWLERQWIRIKHFFKSKK